MQSSLNFISGVELRFKGGTCSTNGSVVVLILNFRQDLKYCVRKSLFILTVLRNMLARVQSFLVPEHLVLIVTTVCTGLISLESAPLIVFNIFSVESIYRSGTCLHFGNSVATYIFLIWVVLSCKDLDSLQLTDSVLAPLRSPVSLTQLAL